MSVPIPKNLYQRYKPLRNLFSEFRIEQSLQDIWNLSEHLLNNHPLPNHSSFNFLRSQFKNLKSIIYPWELATVLREVIINSNDKGSRALTNYNDLRAAINSIRNYGDQIASAKLKKPDQVLKDLHRIAHHQFPWQRNDNLELIIRYRKILGNETVNNIALSRTGLDLKQLMLIGLAARAHLMKNPGFNLEQSYSYFGIDQDKSKHFFERLTIDIDSLKESYIASQSHHELWEYTWNPLEEKPLISISKQFPHLTYCPIPQLFMKRITSGLFFDFVGDKNFANSYGPSFEKFVGDVLNKIFKPDTYSVIKPDPIMQGKKIKHRVDWIIRDESASMLIECKTKRLRVNARIDVDGDHIKEDIKELAKFVVQTYKNLKVEQAKDSPPTHEIPHYYIPTIVTLDDWYLLSPVIREFLQNEIKQLLDKAGIPESLLITNPFTIMSVSELETIGQVIQKIGIKNFFSKKNLPEYKDWDLRGFCNQEYKSEQRHLSNRLFMDEWAELRSELESHIPGSNLAKRHFNHSETCTPLSATLTQSPDIPDGLHHQSGVTKSLLNRPSTARAWRYQ